MGQRLARQTIDPKLIIADDPQESPGYSGNPTPLEAPPAPVVAPTTTPRPPQTPTPQPTVEENPYNYATRLEILASGRADDIPAEVFHRGDSVGLGVRATRNVRKGEVVGVYHGPVREHDPDPERPDIETDYVVQLPRGLEMDGRPQAGSEIQSPFIGAFFNDYRRLAGHPNAEFQNGFIVVDGQKHWVCWIRTTERVGQGQEFFIDYGEEYWDL